MTDAADAAAGVRDGDYYFAVTIPDDFSADLVSAGGDDADRGADRRHLQRRQLVHRHDPRPLGDGPRARRGRRDRRRAGRRPGAGRARVGPRRDAAGGRRRGSLRDAVRRSSVTARSRWPTVRPTPGTARRRWPPAPRRSTTGSAGRRAVPAHSRAPHSCRPVHAPPRTRADPCAAGTPAVADGVHTATQQVDAVAGRLPVLADGLTEVGAYLAPGGGG